MKQLLLKLKLLVKPVGNWTLFIVSCISTFFLGYYYPVLHKTLHEEPKKFKEAKTLDKCSISITDRGELLIIDRTSGTFEVYKENVGLTIFRSYGTSITNNQPR